MEATTVVPMTFQSPQFVLLVLTILAVVGVFYLAFSTVAKSSAMEGPYDSARTLTNTALIMVSLVFVYLAGVVAYQVYTSPSGTATTEAWGQFCLFVGWVLGKAGDIYNARFITTKQSAEKDDTIRQLTRSNAVTQDALLDPSLTVSKTGAPMARAAIDPAAVPATPSDKPLQTDTLNVVAQTVNADEIDPKKP